MRTLWTVAFAAVLLAGSLSAHAQEPTAAPTLDATQKQIEELKKQVEALAQQVKVLERKQEIEKEEQAAKAKTAPVVTAGKDGVAIGTADKAFSMKINGSIGYDWSWFNQDDSLKLSIGDEQDGTGFNFARIRLSGNVYDNIEYIMEYDFATETGADGPEFKDVYLQLNDIPYGGERTGSLRAGHFREPISFEEMTAVRFRMFTERSLMNVFIPSRNAGIQWNDALLGEDKKERLTYALGVFKTTDNWPSANDSDEDQGYSFTGRVTGLPYYAEDGRQLVHVGAGYSHRNPDGAVLGWSARPENKLSPFRYVNSEGFNLYRLRDARADDVDLYNLELASVFGPLTFESEYTLADVDTTFDGNREFSGYYAQLGYFLTGEYRPYKNNQGVFDRVKPLKNFGFKADNGLGAWELTARYSDVDLNDGGVRGGEQNDITLGVNWFLNPNTRIMWNYIHGDVDHDLYDGDFDALQMRFQVDF